jgi:hypothetical protein
MSPQGVHQSSSPPRVVVPTAPNQTTPNPHRILQTSPRRFVTPTTPHHMVRRSAGPHKLSQEMLEETVQQANNIFSLPIGTSVTPVLLAPINKHITMIPEMANSVICPNTGNYLKNNELITLLRHTIRWIRSTAN